MLSKQHTIHLISTIDNQITITFNTEWFQEDISTLSQLILSKIPHHQLKEKIIGADRENLRFTWQTSEFLLNFDYYSQSCWINAHDEISQMTILALNKLLTASSPNNE